MCNCPEKRASFGWITGFCLGAVTAASLVAGAITVKFDASLQIGGTCDHAQAAYAVKVSVVATGSCSEDGWCQRSGLYERAA